MSCNYCQTKEPKNKCGGSCDNAFYCTQECADADFIRHQVVCIGGRTKMEKKRGNRDKIWSDWGIKFKAEQPLPRLSTEERAKLDPENILIDLQFQECQIQWKSQASADSWKVKGVNRLRTFIYNAFEIENLMTISEELSSRIPDFTGLDTAPQGIIVIITTEIYYGSVTVYYEPEHIDFDRLQVFVEQANFWKKSYLPRTEVTRGGCVRMSIIVRGRRIQEFPLPKINFNQGLEEVFAMSQEELVKALEHSIENAYRENYDSALKFMDRLRKLVITFKREYGLYYQPFLDGFLDEILRRFHILPTKFRTISELVSKLRAIFMQDETGNWPWLSTSLNVTGEYIDAWKIFWDHNVSFVRTFNKWKDDQLYKLMNGLMWGTLDPSSSDFKYAPAYVVRLYINELVADFKTIWRQGLAPTYQESLFVTRAFWMASESLDQKQRGPDFSLLKPGDQIRNLGLLATSYTVPPSNFYGGQCCIMRIEICSNVPRVILKTHRNVFDAEFENEVLLPPNTIMEFVAFNTYLIGERMVMRVAEFKICNYQWPDDSI